MRHRYLDASFFPSSGDLMRRLALPILALLACGLVFLADAQGAPSSCGAGFAAPSTQQIRETPPSVPGRWTLPLPLSYLTEIGGDLSGEAGAGPYSTTATLPATTRTTVAVAAGTSGTKRGVVVLPLYHLYCVLLI